MTRNPDQAGPLIVPNFKAGFQMVLRVLSRLLVMLFGLALGLGFCELALSVVVRSDADGNRTYRGIRLKPFALPQRRLAQLLDQLHASNASAVVYSPELGWDSRPVVAIAGADTLLTPGFRARRSPEQYALAAPNDTLRILLFGDSFTACATPETETWGHVLEDVVRKRGRAVEVLNFGLGGYGIDQAYLRWRKYGQRYHPDVVVFGFQPENVKRDLNLIRLIYTPDTGLPFSKPRFVRSGDSLELVNVPAAPPESLPAILAHIDRWPLRQYEAFYNAADYADHPWLHGKLLPFTGAVLRTRSPHMRAQERAYYDPAGSTASLALEILKQFDTEVRASGAQFMVIDLPRREDLRPLFEGKGEKVYEELRAELRKRYGLIDPRPEFAATAGEPGLKALFQTDSHYNARGNRAVAAALARVLEQRQWLPGQSLAALNTASRSSGAVNMASSPASSRGHSSIGRSQ